jgi:hypothetical protein
MGGPFLGELQAVDLGVVTNIHGQGTLKDDFLHSIGLGIDPGEVA